MSSIIVPMMIAGTQLAFLAPEVIFGMKAKGKWLFSFLAWPIFPLHPLIMSVREEILNRKLCGKREKNLEAHRVKIRSEMRQFKRCELGIESVYQLCGQAILAFYAISVTKTTDGLVQLFEANPEDTFGENNVPSVFKSKSFILTYLTLSTFWSCYSCLKSSSESLSLKREHFPIAAKVVAKMFIISSLLKRVVSVVMYFAVPLGLFNLLRHGQSEQVKWDPIYEEAFLDQDGYIQFGDSPKILWSSINRWNSTSDIPPNYRLYTIFGHKEYFLGFWIILIFQSIAILLAKLKFSQAFRELSKGKKALDVLENINIAQCTEDWDHRNGSAKDHIARKNANWKEFFVLSVLSYVFNFILLIPLSVLGK